MVGEVVKSEFRILMRQKDRIKQKRNKSDAIFPYSFGKSQRDGYFQSHQRDSGQARSQRNDTKRKQSVAERPVLLPALPKRTPLEMNMRNLACGFPFQPKTKDRTPNTFPKFLPKIDLETRNAELSEDNKGKIWANNRLPPLKTIVVPLRTARDALSTAATLRGLVKLTSEEKCILRFRLSNYRYAKEMTASPLN